jgi:hypothetical protein
VLGLIQKVKLDYGDERKRWVAINRQFKAQKGEEAKSKDTTNKLDSNFNEKEVIRKC